MNRREFLGTGLTAVAVPLFSHRLGAVPQGAALPPLPAADAEGWIQLFNGRNLDNLYVCLRATGVNNDPLGYVKVENGMLHIMGNPIGEQPADTGFIASQREFDDCRVRVEYKWGEKVHPPGQVTRRDNGLIYRIVGPDMVFPTCVEFQLVQGMVGDASFLSGSRGLQGDVQGFPTRGRGPAAFAAPGAPGGAGAPGGGAPAGAAPPAPVAPPPPPPAPAAGAPQAGDAAGGQAPGGGAPGGRGAGGRAGGRGGGGGRGVSREGDFDSATDWNTLEVVMRGDQSVHIVNGNVVATITSLQRPDPQNQGSFLPLTRGKFGMQIYYSEIFIRKMAVRSL